MIFSLFRRSDNRLVIEALYAAIVDASRHPTLFSDFCIADTFEGRFESLTLHAALVLRRLNALAVPGPEVAQDLIDMIFRHFDRTLREIGVGDTIVPKRMKGLAEAFLGRSSAYNDALRNGSDAVADALTRNIVSQGAPTDLRGLTRYVEATAAGLDEASIETFVDGRPPFLNPALFLSKASI